MASVLVTRILELKVALANFFPITSLSAYGNFGNFVGIPNDGCYNGRDQS